MKPARTFTIDTELAKDLRQKRNQSQFVEDAIKAKLYPSSVFSGYPRLNEATTDEIARALFSRTDDQTLKAVLEALISSNRDEDL